MVFCEEQKAEVFSSCLFFMKNTAFYGKQKTAVSPLNCSQTDTNWFSLQTSILAYGLVCGSAKNHEPNHKNVICAHA